jgi:NAD+ diphosphatase
VAGFCEIGETPEDTVRREVLEETGIAVEDVRYFASQPWGFSSSLLLGFTARRTGTDRIAVQEAELAEARWISRAELPESDPAVSLTATMMEAFRLGTL